MTLEEIQKTVIDVIQDYCDANDISANLETSTPLIGGNKIMDSMGLVMVIVDIETAFLEEDVEVSLTSEAAMSSAISPFRTIGSLSNFISKQINE